MLRRLFGRIEAKEDRDAGETLAHGSGGRGAQQPPQYRQGEQAEQQEGRGETEGAELHHPLTRFA